MNWSDWTSLDAVPGYGGPAVYEFRLVADGHPVPIPRLLGTDPDGLLVIGCTGNMAQRHCQSQTDRKSANGSSTMNLLFYWERYTVLPRVFPGFGNEYHFIRLETVEAAKLLESQLLN